VSAASVELELRLRMRRGLAGALGLFAVTALVGALFPSLGHSIGDINLPKGLANLLGGGDYATLRGWLETEIVSTYGPLIVGGIAVSSAAATLAGEEEDRILALVLAQPEPRGRLLRSKAAGVGVLVLALGVVTWLALLLAVALAGGGIDAGHLAAQALQLTALGLALGALALAIGAATGRRAAAGGAAAAIALLMYLVNGLAPLADSVAWLRYLSLFHYYAAGEPLARGPDPGGLAVLVAAALALTAVALAAFSRRDLRG